MQEMVSRRGVAKKRRKQEVGVAVCQMFACCCDHATIVAWRQPFCGAIEPFCRLFRRDESSAVTEFPGRHNLRVFGGDVAPSRILFDSSHPATGLGERPSGLRISRDATRATPALHFKRSIRAIVLAATLRAENYDADINRNERDRVIFVRSIMRPALFAPVFVTTMWRTACAQSVGTSFIRKTKQRHTLFVAHVLISDEK
jgi:hypothetical protein